MASRQHRNPDIVYKRKGGLQTVSIAYTFGICTMVLAGGWLSLVAAQDTAKKAAMGPGLTLTTPAFADGGEIPAKFTQSDPKPISPRLQWTNVPANTITFALIMH